MKKTLLIMVSVLMVLPIVSATSFNYTLGYTSLPFVKLEPVLINGTSGLTVNITYGNFTSGINAINFVGDTEYLTVGLNIPIGTPVSNYTSTVSIDGGENYSAEILFNFFVLNDTNLINYTDYIQIDINEFEYTTCDYLQPLNYTKQINIQGTSGQTVMSDYDHGLFTLLPADSFVMPSTNYSLLDILIRLNNLSVGYHTSVIKFNLVSEFNNVTFHFNILDCLTPPPDINELLESCRGENLTISQYMLCIAAMTKYWNSYYQAIAETQNKTVVNNTIVEQINNTVYKDIVSENPDLIQTLKDVVLTWNQYRTAMKTADTKDKEIEELKAANSQVWEEANKRMGEQVQSLVEQNRMQQEILSYYDKHYIKKSLLYLIMGLLTVIIGLGIAYWYNSLNTWW